MKYKVGDKVRIVSDKSKSDGWNPQRKMDHWLGKVMTIKCCHGVYYDMIEDYDENYGLGWAWFEDMIEGLADEPKKEDKEIKDWSESEIQQARLLTTNLLTEIIYI